MLHTVFTILPVFLILLSGYGAGRLGLIPPDSAQVINRFVIWIPMPVLVFHIVAKADWVHVWDSGFVVASLTGSALIFVGGMMVGRWRDLRLSDRAINGLSASYSNVGYLGLPMLPLAFGPSATTFAVTAFSLTLSSLFAATILIVELETHRSLGIIHAIGKAFLKTIRNPVIIAPILGLAWYFSGLAIPDAMEQFLTLTGNAASPSALIGIGLLLAQHPITDSIFDRNVIRLSALKLIVHPAITAVIAVYILHLAPRIALITIVIAAMPTGTGPFMMAGLYEREGKVTTGTILATTTLSMATITAILTLFPA
jgi:malonate transporter and related proteins